MKLLLFIIVFLFANIVFANNPGVSYQGRIFKPDGYPLEGANVQFRMQVRSPGAENCLLFEEIQTVNMSGSAGIFSITLNDGTGTRLDTPTYQVDRIFANREVMTLDTTRCAAGTTYTPNTADGRKFVVYFKDETMAAYEPLPVMNLNYAPQAMYALEAQKIGTFAVNNILRAVDVSGNPVTAPALNPTQLTNLNNLLSGTSSQYATAADFSTVQTFAKATLPTCSSGEVLKSNGTVFSCVVDSAGGAPAYSAITAASAVNSIDNTNYAQTWSWSTATTQSPMSLSANALTTGSGLNLTTSSASLNSTNGFLNVANTGASTNGILARMQSNSTAGSGLTVLTDGNVGIGTASPAGILDVRGGTAVTGNGTHINLYAQNGLQSGNTHGGSMVFNAGVGYNGGGGTLTFQAGGSNRTTGPPTNGSSLVLGGAPYDVGEGGFIQLYGGTGVNGTGSGGAININNAGASANGGRLDIVGGNAYGTGPALGGNVRIDAGAGGSTGSPGKILLSTVIGGNVGIGTSSPTAKLHVIGSNATGSSNAIDVLTIKGGNGGPTGGNGGGVSIIGGDNTAYMAGTGGQITLIGGNGTNGGGTIALTAGSGTAMTGSGASISLLGGVNGGVAGDVTLSSGNGGNGSSPGGTTNILSGNGASGGGATNGGPLNITAGSGVSGGNGANVTILGGAKNGVGSDGNVLLATTRGNVGIKTIAPTEALEVSGNIKLSGFILNQETWIAPSFLNSWIDYGGVVYAPVGYFKDKNGIVHLRGLMKSGTCGAAAFNLPVGYRPAYRLIMSTITNTGTGVGRLDVFATGDISPDVTLCNNSYFSLDGVSFKAEQ